ncbi:hypothetical protein BVRB_4g072370 [Beta vulgaris subsp. vulgaris]|nr:hypothetical protein BVRB_4g072370 [Beta vulgaris subsp. vulgaris]
MVLVALWIFFPIAKYVPSIKQVTFLDLPLTRWVVIISIICGFYLISYVVYMLTHRITRILNVRSLNVAQAFSEIIDGLIFWWAEHEVMKRVPTFKNHEILGLPTRKWLRVSILVLIGYNLITLFTHIAVMSLRRICQQHLKIAHENFWQNVLGRHLHKKFIVYFANGMKLSISFIMSSLLLLLTWVLYFGPRLDMKIGKTKSIWEYGLWTLLTLLICAFFWLIKTFVLLAWEVHTVYNRLEHRIISISEQLYFLGILDCDKHDIFKLRNDIVEDDDNEQEASTVQNSQRGGDNSLTKCFSLIVTSLFDLIPKGAKKKLNLEKKERIKNELLLHKDPTMDDLQRASHFFIVAKRKLLKETYISDILESFDTTSNNREKLKQIIDHHEKNQGKILMKLRTFQRERGSGEEGVDKEDDQEGAAHSSTTNCAKQINDWDQFVIKLPKQSENSPTISYADIQTWVVKSCANLGTGCFHKLG